MKVKQLQDLVPRLSRYSTSLVLAVVLVVMSPGQARALEGSDTLSLNYAIRAQGFEVLSLRMNIIVTGDRYLATIRAQTLGLADLLSSFKARYTAAGTMTDTGLSPARFEHQLENKSRARAARVAWDSDGRHRVKLNPAQSPGKKQDIAIHLKPGMPDPLSLVAALLLNRAARPCLAKARVFNGRRVFALEFAAQPGQAREPEVKNQLACRVTNRPIAGYSARKMAKSAASPQKPLIIKLAPSGRFVAGRQVMLPLSAHGSIDWVAIEVRLKNAWINGTLVAAPPKAAPRK